MTWRATRSRRTRKTVHGVWLWWSVRPPAATCSEAATPGTIRTASARKTAFTATSALADLRGGCRGCSPARHGQEWAVRVQRTFLLDCEVMLAGIAAVSAALLMTELALTRIFSVT